MQSAKGTRIIALVAMLALSACGAGSPELMNLTSGGEGPDEFGIVPPKPLYWSKVNWLADKKAYRQEMARFASVDPQRADEWTLAGKVL